LLSRQPASSHHVLVVQAHNHPIGLPPCLTDLPKIFLDIVFEQFRFGHHVSAGADRRRTFAIADNHAFKVGKTRICSSQDFTQREKLRLAKNSEPARWHNIAAESQSALALFRLVEHRIVELRFENDIGASAVLSSQMPPPPAP